MVNLSITETYELQIMGLHKSLSPSSKSDPQLLLADSRQYQLFCFQVLCWFTQNARHSCLFKSSQLADQLHTVPVRFVANECFVRDADTAAALALIILNVAVIFKSHGTG